MRIPLKTIPHEIINTYDLKAMVDDQVWIYMHIKKCMHILKHAGITAKQELVKHMAPFVSSYETHTRHMGP